MKIKISDLIGRPLIKSTVIYGFGNISNAAVYIVLLPLLTRAFSPAEYGLMELISVTILIISAIAGLSLDSAMLRFFNKDDTPERKKAICSTIVFTSTVSSVILLILSFLFFNFIDIKIFKRASMPLFLALADIPFSVFIANVLSLLRIQEKALRFCMVSFLKIVLAFTITFILIKFFSLGISSLFVAILIADILLALANLPYLANYVAMDFSGAILNKIISYSMPLIFSSLIIVLLSNINKYFLQHFQGLKVVGIYGVGQKVSMVLGIAGASFRQAWIPYAFSIIKEEKSRSIYSRAFKIFLLVFFACATLLSLLAYWIIPVISSRDYLPASLIVGYVCAGIILVNLSGSFFNLGIHIKQETKLSAIAYILGLIANIVFNFLFIPRFSILGASLALLIGYFVTAMLLLFFSNKLYKIPYDLRLFFIIFCGYLLFASFLVLKSPVFMK